MALERTPLLTQEEYLAFERQSEMKHEYVAGEILAMTGVSRRHSLINTTTSAYLEFRLRDRPCELHQSDVRVKIAKLGIYTYPDIVVVCGKPEFEDPEVDTLLNPTVIIEILSPSTQSYDRRLKFHRYQLIPSFREYLLIAQDARRVDHYIRQPDDRWFPTTYTHPDDVITLPSLDCTLPLAEVYRRVTFDRSAPVEEAGPSA
jgi:Uma2 family endonuclease